MFLNTQYWFFLFLFWPLRFASAGPSFTGTHSFTPPQHPALTEIPVFYNTYSCVSSHIILVFPFLLRFASAQPVFQRDWGLHHFPASRTVLGLGCPAGDAMASVPLFDPTCPWKASCKSRKITTGAGLLRHLQRFHKLGDAGRDDWVSQLRSPAEYRKLEAILRATSSWLCTTCFKTHSLGVLSCATNPDTCQRLWNLEDGLVPPDVNLLPGLPRPAPPPQDTSEPQGRLHSQPRGRPRASAAVADPPPSAPPARVRRHPLTPALVHQVFTLGHC